MPGGSGVRQMGKGRGAGRTGMGVVVGCGEARASSLPPGCRGFQMACCGHDFPQRASDDGRGGDT